MFLVCSISFFYLRSTAYTVCSHTLKVMIFRIVFGPNVACLFGPTEIAKMVRPKMKSNKMLNDQNILCHWMNIIGNRFGRNDISWIWIRQMIYRQIQAFNNGRTPIISVKVWVKPSLLRIWLWVVILLFGFLVFQKEHHMMQGDCCSLYRIKILFQSSHWNWVLFLYCIDADGYCVTGAWVQRMESNGQSQVKSSTKWLWKHNS